MTTSQHTPVRRWQAIWTAKLEVPAEGVKTPPPNLNEFQPEALEFVPPQKASRQKV